MNHGHIINDWDGTDKNGKPHQFWTIFIYH